MNPYDYVAIAIGLVALAIIVGGIIAAFTDEETEPDVVPQDELFKRIAERQTRKVRAVSGNEACHTDITRRVCADQFQHQQERTR